MKAATLFLAVLLAIASGCGGKNAVKHSDYGDCHRAGRHLHNDHVFIGDYHDHTLCEWAKFE